MIVLNKVADIYRDIYYNFGNEWLFIKNKYLIIIILVIIIIKIIKMITQKLTDIIIEYNVNFMDIRNDMSKIKKTLRVYGDKMSLQINDVKRENKVFQQKCDNLDNNLIKLISEVNILLDSQEHGEVGVLDCSMFLSRCKTKELMAKRGHDKYSKSDNCHSNKNIKINK